MALNFTPTYTKNYTKTSKDYTLPEYSQSYETRHAGKKANNLVDKATGMHYTRSDAVKNDKHEYNKQYKALQNMSFDPSKQTNAAYDYYQGKINSEPGEYSEAASVADLRNAWQAVENAKPGDFEFDDTALQNVYDKIMNREDFSFDLNSSALYQQYKDQYVALGQQAMMDTMGQAAALTGGYASSAAQAAGQGAYNQQLQNLTNIIPELYSQALQTYQMEGNQLLDQYGVASAERSNAYGQWRDKIADWGNERNFAYGAYRDEQSFDYGKYQDSYNNWLNSTGLALDAYSTLWGQDFNKYQSDVNKQTDIANMAWNQYQYQNDFDFNKFLNQQDAYFKAGDYYNSRYQTGLQNDMNIWKQLTQNKQWQAGYDLDAAQLNANINNQNNQIGLDVAVANDNSKYNWDKFNWTKETDARDFNYQKERDKVGDNQWEKTFNYNAGQDAIANAQKQQQIDEQIRSNKAGEKIDWAKILGSGKPSEDSTVYYVDEDGKEYSEDEYNEIMELAGLMANGITNEVNSKTGSGSKSSGSKLGDSLFNGFSKIGDGLSRIFGGGTNNAISPALTTYSDGTSSLDISKLSKEANTLIARLRRTPDGQPNNAWFESVIAAADSGKITADEANALLIYYKYGEKK